MIRRARALWCLTIVTAGLITVQASAQELQTPVLEVLLRRGGEYAQDFVAQFANVVAEEQYLQTWRNFRRTVVSDFLLVQPKDTQAYFAFRDVVTVDGSPVKDRDQRVIKLLVQPSASTVERLAEFSKEAARFTFGGVFNNPLVALAFLQPEFRERFRFSLGKVDKSLGANVWDLGFTEQTRPTVLRGRNNSDQSAAGHIWVEADTGRVVKTELTLTNDSVITSFKFDERFQINVPVEMIDRYRYQNYTVNGTATFGRFRRFNVSTDENVATPEQKGDASPDQKIP
jgi:hypothetical protein